MRSLLTFALCALSLLRVASGATLTPNAAQVQVARAQITGSRTTDILANIPGLVPFPKAFAVESPSVPFDNVQSDIMAGMQKNKETFMFFSIKNTKSFKRKLRTVVAPFITSAKQLMNVKTQPRVMLNVAFSQSGLHMLGVMDNLGDPVFAAGQFADAAFLGDPGTGNWESAFKGTFLHGVFLFSSDSTILNEAMATFLHGVFKSDIVEQHRLDTAMRTGDQAGHEPFGFLDGIGQPAISEFHSPFPGQLVIDPGFLLLNEKSDPVTTRPAWTKDGSFLAFRQLQQLVPEFHTFLNRSSPAVQGLSHKESSELMGARMVGRWKSGAPVDKFPLRDPGPKIGKDVMLNNDFDYTHPGFNFTSDQSHCPFAAHIRKTRPRQDLVAPINSIMRASVPYGPEVSAIEERSGRSDPRKERGIAFVSYQSVIANGFQFLQHFWANNVNFVFNKTVSPGFDPIIGANAGQARLTQGLNAQDNDLPTTFNNDFIVSRGGEYFFSPSISAIKTVLTE